MGSGVGKTMKISQFNHVSTWSQSPVPLRAGVLWSPLRLSINTFSRVASPHLNLLPAVRPGYPVLPVVRGFTFGGLLYPIQRVGAKGGTTWKLIRGWDILVHPSPYGWADLLPTSYIWRISSVFTWRRHGLLPGDWLYISP